MDRIASKSELTAINPIDCDCVFVENEGRAFAFDYASTLTPNGDTVIAPGTFEPDHPTHASQPFMSGCWIAR